MTGHFTAFLGFVMNDKLFRSYPQDIQKILAEEAEKAGDKMTQMTIDNDKKLIEELKKQGVTVVSNVNIAAFRAASAPVYSAFPKWTPGLHDKILKILAL